MSVDQVNGNNAIVGPNLSCMESVNRISKLPMVESTIQTATNIYGKVKVSHFSFNFIKWIVPYLTLVQLKCHICTSGHLFLQEYNTVTNTLLSTAETTVYKAVEVGKPIMTPVIHNLEGPIKKVDSVLCTGLDYVESKVPAVKLPPNEVSGYPVMCEGNFDVICYSS